MNFDDLREYFKTYIKKYTPYNGDRVYDVLVDYILEQYLNDSYTHIPEGMKALYEDNILSESIFNQLLFAVGVHDEVIKKMKTTDKRIFISALSDFQRYKGSVKFFRQVGSAYRDKFNVYELYVDFADGQWILRPYLIYEGIKNNKSPGTIPYVWAYQTIPTLFVSPEQLDYYRSNKLAAFPLKTNILSLQYSMEIYCSEMITLSLATFLKDYGHTYITVYHQDETFSIQLKYIYYIWTYILATYYKTAFYNLPLTRLLLYSNETNPYSMEDVDYLWKLYDDLTYSSDLYEFYKQYLLNVFETFHKAEEFTPDDMDGVVMGINKQYHSYITNRLNDPEFVSNKTARMNAFNELTNEIYDSLLLYQDNIAKTTTNNELFLKYFDIFLNSLSHIVVDPKDTVSYLLLYNFKPYHTEFLTEASSAIVIDDKFNSITLKDEQVFLFNLILADYLDSMTTYIRDFEFIFNTESRQEQVDVVHHHFKYPTIDDEGADMKDYIRDFIFKLILHDVQEINNQFISKLKMLQKSELAEIDYLKTHMFAKQFINYGLELLDKINFDILSNYADFEHIIFLFKTFIGWKHQTESTTIDHFKSFYEHKFLDEYGEDVKDYPLYNYIFKHMDFQEYKNTNKYEYTLHSLIEGNLNVKDEIEVFLT